MKSARGSGSVISFGDVQQAYHRYAPIYDWLWGAILQPGRRELARAASSLCTTGHSLLEVGVGTGLMLPLYSGEFAVTGVDITEDMLARAREKVRQLPGRHIELKLMDGEKLAFADGTFDCVALPYVLSVTPDPARLIAEARRVCRSNGVILILNHFNGSHAWWLLERIARPLSARIGFRSDFSLEEHVLQRGDLKIERIDKVNLLDLSRLLVVRNA